MLVGEDDPLPSEKTLTPELVALVHHVELNRAGWWDVAIEKLLLTAFHLEPSKVTLSSSEVREVLKSSFAVEIDEAAVQEHLAQLVTAGQVLEPQLGRFKATETTLKKCEEDVALATQLESAVKARFSELLFRHCPSIDPEIGWNQFVEKFLIPLVRQLGAATYQLLEGSRAFSQLPHLAEFISCFEPAYAPGLESFLREFLNPADAPLRRYVLRTMNAFFVVRAGGLSKNIVDRLASKAKGFEATLFFDSNVLFSLLGLHENPADESSRKLVSVVRRLSSDMPIKLRVLPPTLDEMKRALKASQEELINLRIASSLLRPAINAGLTGITVKYLTLASERKGIVTPADYFEPYLKNLVTILHDNGVDIFNEDTARYRTRQDVVDDILQQRDFEKQRYGPTAKDYERLEHDIVLWHFVDDKRPPRPDSPLDAKYWIITADFRLLGFDAFKHKDGIGEIPLCLHPIALVQLLQFWIPLDTDLEEALFSAIRLPAVLAPLGDDTEKISLQILNALSTFENIGDMPEETTTRILLNDALRQKLALENSVEGQIQLVKEALIEENKIAEERIRLEKAKSREIEEQYKSLEMRLAQSLGAVANLRADLQQTTERERAAQLAADEAIHRERETGEKIERLIHEHEVMKDEARQRRLRTRRIVFVACYAMTLVILLSADIAIRRFAPRHELLISAEVIVGMLWLFGFGWWGSENEAVKQWKPFLVAKKAKVWLLLAILGGIIGNAAWEMIKASNAGTQHTAPRSTKPQPPQHK